MEGGKKVTKLVFSTFGIDFFDAIKHEWNGNVSIYYSKLFRLEREKFF